MSCKKEKSGGAKGGEEIEGGSQSSTSIVKVSGRDTSLSVEDPCSKPIAVRATTGTSASGVDEDMAMEKRRHQNTVKSLIASPDVNDFEKRGVLRKVWILMEEPGIHPVALWIHYIYSSLILLSVISTVISTLESLSKGLRLALRIAELFFNVTFTIECLARVITAPQKKVLVRNMYMWMDVGAIVPFYVMLISGVESDSNKYLELLTLLVPILRVLKITRHSSGWRLLLISINDCLTPLGVPAFLLLLMTVFASCVIFWIEKHSACEGATCDEKDMKAFESIPHTMWFTIVTISTVGYGDVWPHTDAARFASSALILAGVCYMAMPLAIIGGTFSQVWEEKDRILLKAKTRNRLAEGGMKVDKLKELFEAADEDHSGLLSRSEFVNMVDAFQLGLTRAQIVRLFKIMDDDNSGKINFDEFVFFLFPELEVNEEEESQENAVQPVEDVSAPDAVEAWEDTAMGTSPNALRAAGNASKDAQKGQKKETELEKANDKSQDKSIMVERSISDEVSPLTVAPPHEDKQMELLDRRLSHLELIVSELKTEQQDHFEAQRKLLKALSEVPTPR
mmetsp:Transcript_68634/g.146986  ORF Transcript_68634/g.146986 Transcript_68634/m.146986 type:complete len:567 (+) Transcript_68634:77-1777(+)